MSSTDAQSGLLVVFEGIDGTGKSTLMQRLLAYCESHQLPCVTDREPTHGQWGRQLRASAGTDRLDLATELDLFLKDRAEHVAEFIQPALTAGKIMLLDRYYLSTAAYQGARGADPEEILATNERFAPLPDLVLLLDADPSIGAGRITQRGQRPDSFEDLAYQRDVRRIFLSLRRPFIRIIDATRPVETVWQECLNYFLATLARRRR
jgi:dTMP kinase